MDDVLEQPGAIAAPDPNADAANINSSDDEGDALDWSKVPTAIADSTVRPFIPKRGEKDFQPTEGSNLQAYNLQRSRESMFTVLRTSKVVSRSGLESSLPHYVHLIERRPSAKALATVFGCPLSQECM
jgi:tRNA-splicing endonuclease subunit Sen54